MSRLRVNVTRNKDGVPAVLPLLNPKEMKRLKGAGQCAIVKAIDNNRVIERNGEEPGE